MRRADNHSGGREDCNGNGIDDAQDLADWGTRFDHFSSWRAFDAGDQGVGEDPDGYWDAAFDGRFVYFAPFDNGSGRHGEVLRYDTAGDFSTADSWATFDAGDHGVGADPDGYAGAIFDGRFVYFVPADNGTGGAHGEVLRYDTWADFDDAASWAAFDPGAEGLGDDPDGYNGGTFDGRYVYFSPYHNGTVRHSEVLRYDTEGDFEDIASWAVFDPHDYGVNEDYGYYGAVFDGRYVYFVPNCKTDTIYHGEVLRYDTWGEFAQPSSWSAFEPGDHGVGTTPEGYTGGIFDGRFIYFAPGYDSVTGWHGEVLRYDTTAAFDEAGSWTTFDPGAEGVGDDPDGFMGGFFDGRFICFVPCFKSSTYHGEVLRYDTAGAFDDVAAWDTFDLEEHGVGQEASGFAGGAYDGRYLYLAPVRWAGPHGEVVRHDTAALGSPDCNANGIPDECDIDDGAPDCNVNGVPDECDIAHGFSWDFDGDGVPDECQVDCNENGIGDMEEVATWGTMFDDVSAWAAFDAGDHGVGTDPDGYWSAVFDGRYVYFVPYDNGTTKHGEVMRYDTQGGFDDAGAWATYDPGDHGVGSDPDGFMEAIFDGRFVYFVPHDNGTTQHGEVLRYDTEADFFEASSWAAFDPGANGVGNDPDGYDGAAFDGRYVYFSPYDNGTTHHSEILRYDTTGEFEQAGSWRTFDPRDHGVNDDYGYCGAVFDGRYVYFVPNCRSDTQHHGEVLRYDTARDFLQASAWAAFDPGDHGVGTRPDGYVDGIYDGRYIYFVPCYKEVYGYHGEVLRYDTDSAFDEVDAWTTFDPGAAGVGDDPDGFLGGFTDGRFVYFVPCYNGSSFHGEMMRYDTTGAFNDPDAWDTFDAGAHGVGEETGGYVGGAYDGRYFYLAPGRWSNEHGQVMRYDVAAIGAPDCDGNGVPDECDLADGAPDCNENGIPDECDIAHGFSFDTNENGIPDECEGSCPGDFDEDGDVDTADLLHLLGAWGTAEGDMDGDGDTDTADLLALLGAWGDCPGEPCPWDFNGDDFVDDLDRDILMEHWGECPDPPEECPWDLNGDGVVDGLDLMELLDHYGPCP